MESVDCFCLEFQFVVPPSLRQVEWSYWGTHFQPLFGLVVVSVEEVWIFLEGGDQDVFLEGRLVLRELSFSEQGEMWRGESEGERWRGERWSHPSLH